MLRMPCTWCGGCADRCRPSRVEARRATKSGAAEFSTRSARTEARAMPEFLRRHAAKVGTGFLVAILYALSFPQGLPADEMSELAARFRFEAMTIEPAENGVALRRIRNVHPALARID